jgi:hypothetical protein
VISSVRAVEAGTDTKKEGNPAEPCALHGLASCSFVGPRARSPVLGGFFRPVLFFRPPPSGPREALPARPPPATNVPNCLSAVGAYLLTVAAGGLAWEVARLPLHTPSLSHKPNSIRRAR